jgi:hypothetical protein
MKERLFTSLMLFLVVLAMSACKSGVPGPQNAIGASVRLLSVSPRVALPQAAPSDHSLNSNTPSDQIPFQSQLAQ